MTEHNVNLNIKLDTNEVEDLFEELQNNIRVLKANLEKMNDIEVTLEMETDSNEEELVYDQDEAIEFIQTSFYKEGKIEVTKDVIVKILDLDEDYMRSKGIIED